MQEKITIKNIREIYDVIMSEVLCMLLRHIFSIYCLHCI